MTFLFLSQFTPVRRLSPKAKCKKYLTPSNIKRLPSSSCAKTVKTKKEVFGGVFVSHWRDLVLSFQGFTNKENSVSLGNHQWENILGDTTCSHSNNSKWNLEILANVTTIVSLFEMASEWRVGALNWWFFSSCNKRICCVWTLQRKCFAVRSFLDTFHLVWFYSLSKLLISSSDLVVF